jgi:hypothetical protein
MNIPFKKTEPTKLEEELDRLLTELHNEEPDSERYSAIADQVAKLYKLKEVDSKNNLSKDAVLSSISSILGIALIVGYEHGHAVTTKAFSFVTKNR